MKFDRFFKKVKEIMSYEDFSFPISTIFLERIIRDNKKIKMVKLLLNNNKIKPEATGNICIEKATNEIKKLLWENNRVKLTLKETHPKMYNDFISKEINNKLIGF